jgi:hypothetical protein
LWSLGDMVSARIGVDVEMHACTHVWRHMRQLFPACYLFGNVQLTVNMCRWARGKPRARRPREGLPGAAQHKHTACGTLEEITDDQKIRGLSTKAAFVAVPSAQGAAGTSATADKARQGSEGEGFEAAKPREPANPFKRTRPDVDPRLSKVIGKDRRSSSAPASVQVCLGPFCLLSTGEIAHLD